MPRMAEASIQWKVDALRGIISAPLHSQWVPSPETQDLDWFIDMKKDGYVDGNLGICEGKQVFTELHVTEKGKRLVRDYEANHQDTEDFKKLDARKILSWDDKKLAEWQSHFKSDQAQWILADQEWKRRSGISTRRIAIAAIVISGLSLLVATVSFFHSLNDVNSSPSQLKRPAQSVIPEQLSKPAQK